jgi:signal transduction histidine kinase/CheY-like chemotaxis protein/HPt (histidine-containing phosphotransfer) domain-containing protein
MVISDIMKVRHDSDSPYHDRILHQYNANLPSSIAGVFVGVGFLTYFFRSSISSELLVGWICYMIGLVVIRGIVALYQTRSTTLSNAQYIAAISLNVFLSGLGWSVVSLFFLDFGEFYLLAITFLALAGICAGTITSLNGFPRLTYLMLALVLLPLAFKLGASDIADRYAFTILTLLFMMIIASGAKTMNRTTRENIENSIRSNRREKHILEIKASENMLKLAKDSAEAVARSKSEFLVTMSHEIRTPMNGVIRMAQLLTDTKLDSEQNEYVDIILQSGNSLLTIINDILDYSKIESGQMTLEPIEFDLERTAYDICSLLLPKVQDKKLELILSYAANCPRLLKGDPGRFRQILMNLVGNALKFTETGHILIEVNCNNIRKSTANMTISVEDTGIGIPLEQQTNLFESFTQADTSTTRKYGGSGLGLAICRRLIRLMDSEIELESAPNEGSRFFFTLDLPIIEKIVPLKHQPLENRRILIIDDNPVNLRVIGLQLEHFKMDVFATLDYQVALQHMRDSAVKGEPVDMAILDHFMPNVDGQKLGQMIIEDPDIPNCPLIMYSSSPRRGDAQMFQTKGFQAYLTKPTMVSILQETLECALGEFESHGKSEGPIITRHRVEDERRLEQIHNFGNLPILLAEDNPINQKVAVSILSKMGFDVIVAKDGIQAISLYQEKPFCLILMDSQMPNMDGLEATAAIRLLEQTGDSHIPIIALTANAMAADRDRCLASGMDDFVPKPFIQEVLYNILKKWIKSARPIQSETEPLLPEKDSTNTETNDPIDFQSLDQLREAMGEDFEELIPVFIESAREILNQLKASFDAGDLPVFSRHAHSLKSSSANLGGFQLSTMAANLEESAKLGNLPESALFIEPLMSEFDRIEAALLDYTA